MIQAATKLCFFRRELPGLVRDRDRDLGGGGEHHLRAVLAGADRVFEEMRCLAPQGDPQRSGQARCCRDRSGCPRTGARVL